MKEKKSEVGWKRNIPNDGLTRALPDPRSASSSLNRPLTALATFLSLQKLVPNQGIVRASWQRAQGVYKYV